MESEVMVKPIYRILITGASGFIGSSLVDGALERGFEVWAGVRRTSSRAYLNDERIHFIELDFAHVDVLRMQLATFKECYGGFEYIVHCAGATKCRHRAEFYEVNGVQTCRFIDALNSLDMVPRQFIYFSTLGIFGAQHEENYAPITAADTPKPNTAYGQSKWYAEQYMMQFPSFPYVIFRPTGVYGPRERDYLLMAQAVRRHVEVSVGFRPQKITFLYIRDLVDAVFLAVEKGVTRRAYSISDGEEYDCHDFAELIRKELGVKWLMHVTCPVPVLRGISYVCEKVSAWVGKTSTLNTDKFYIMKQRNWTCDISAIRRELGYEPRYPLTIGVRETIEWYHRAGWL